MYDKVLCIIASYYCDIKQPTIYDKCRTIELKCTSRCAAMELYLYVERHSSSPISAIEDFMFMMENFAVNSKKNSHIFYTAADIARDIYDIILASI